MDVVVKCRWIFTQSMNNKMITSCFPRFSALCCNDGAILSTLIVCASVLRMCGNDVIAGARRPYWLRHNRCATAILVYVITGARRPFWFMSSARRPIGLRHNRCAAAILDYATTGARRPYWLDRCF